MPTPIDRLLEDAAAVVCELSAGQAEALAREVERAPGPKRIRRVAGLPAPRSIDRMCESWLGAPGVDSTALADAIRCAALAVKTVSSYEKVELLYTGPDGGGLRRNLQGLLEVIRSARTDLWVVSYVVGGGVDSVVQAMQERSTAGVEVNVVVDHRTDTAQATFKRLSAEAPGCDVWVWPDEQRLVAPNLFANLHAKCAIADGRQAFVSSANLTTWAMERNIEVGYLVTGGETPRRLKNHLVALRLSGALKRRDP